jgi:hypothetical protein
MKEVTFKVRVGFPLEKLLKALDDRKCQFSGRPFYPRAGAKNRRRGRKRPSNTNPKNESLIITARIPKDFPTDSRWQILRR